jgi:hypothetical protein
LSCCFLRHAGAQQQPEAGAANEQQLPESPSAQMFGSITGTVTDQDGAMIPAAQVQLLGEGQPQTTARVVASDATGRFAFANVTPGRFQLTVSAQGFTTQQGSAEVVAAETMEVPAIVLEAATNIEVQAITQRQLAEEQLRSEEKQRIFGFIPNFYVTYEPHPVPLAPSQKFQLAWKTSFDPVTFAITGVVAGVQQGQNAYPEWGQGSQGYAKRYAASYGTALTDNLIGSALLPVLLKQDPRYFYKGTGSIHSRALYAISNSVVCKGDNGHWQPNYSSIIGGLASGALANLYYPAASRDGAGLMLEDTAVGIGSTAIANLFQEFLVKKLTPHARRLPQP